MSGVNIRTANHPPNLPLLGYDENHDVFGVHSYVISRVTFTGNTNASGDITVNHKPMVARRRLLDGNGNMNVAADIVATRSDLTDLHVGAVDAKGGTVRLYTDAGLTTPAANLVGVIVAYWYPAPLKGSVQADGTFVPESTTTLTGSYAGYGEDPRGLVPITDPTLLTIPTYDGSGQAVHPSVVYFPRPWNGYKFWMVMTPYPGGDASKENPSIVVSNNGIDWVEPPGITNPIFGPPASSNYSDPHLEFDYANNKLVLYWQHNLTGQIYRSETSNGVAWSAEVEVTGLGTSPSVVKIGTTGTVWEGFVPALNGGLWRCRSTNGTLFTHKTWVNMPVTVGVVGGQMGHSWVGIDDLGYHALLTVAPDNRLWSDCQLYYAFSRNGWDWKVFPAPVIGRNQGFTDAYNIYRSCMVNLGDRMRVYYSASTATKVWRIGYFDAQIGFSDIKFKGPIEIPVFRNREIRDTAVVPGEWWNPGDWNDYTNKSIIYTNGHNVALTLRFTTWFRGSLTLISNSDNLLKYNSGTPAALAGTLAVGDNWTPVCITKSDIPVLGDRLPSGVGLSVQAGSAPASGALNMSLLMWND